MQTTRHTKSRLATLAAHAIQDAFADYRRQFLRVTRRARTHFEKQDLPSLKRDRPLRLQLYRDAVDHAEGAVTELLGEQTRDRITWVSMKAVYSCLIETQQDWDIAETFFNSITRRIFTTVGVDPLIEFVDTDFTTPPVATKELVFRRFDRAPSTQGLCAAALWATTFRAPWVDRSGDAELMAQRIDARLLAMGAPPRAEALEILRHTFYRGTGAYLVGRVYAGSVTLPIAIALHNTPAGVTVDAVLLEESDVSILFSFTRSYFHVVNERPHALVQFLSSVLPRKRKGELYISIGEPKQGKTELYRDLRRHLAESGQRFHIAEGVEGLVMMVFTVPGHDVVLKVMRDHFPPEKRVSHALVRKRYQWVYQNDRAGRIVDAQSFEHLELPEAQFEPDFLELLLSECGKSVRVENGRVIFDLVWIERKVTPLDLYVRAATPEAAAAAMLEYGHAIRDLAACNIFPGDLLLKNFGVTRHGRVAFYDYDEIEPLTDCRFREIPEPETWEQEMASEPWYSVGPQDVFPEEFPRFLGVNRELKRLVTKVHRDIFTAKWWREMQQNILDGGASHFTPYPEDRRLRPAESASS